MVTKDDRQGRRRSGESRSVGGGRGGGGWRKGEGMREDLRGGGRIALDY